ncbi:MAG: choice-of-anchor J domain-containing protein [Phaeodactylibacter sp.]|uniref:T9SS-dependent choice-of-anchor J family protein n=1 Tax=Phaeodactylibacter sp. TaxID=1940289 RepID=UPI0032EB3421
MKRLVQLVCVAIVLATLPVSAQETIVYDFEDGVMPESFTLINRDMLVPNQPDDAGFADTAWMVIESGLLESFGALSISWYVDDAGPADDWMILPKITVTENSTLSWTAISTTSSGDFPDSYQVLINPEEPTFESFEANGAILASYDPEEWEAPQMREASLADYAGQSVHIAFRNITPSGDALLIDDITITEGEISSVAALDNAAFEFNLAPNPATAAGTTLQYTLEQAADVAITVQDLSGRAVQELRQGRLAAGRHNVQLETAGLPAGVYVVSVRTAEKVGTTQLFVR